MVSELSIIFIITPNPSPPPDGHCAGGTHPTGMHSCFKWKLKLQLSHIELFIHYLFRFQKCIIIIVAYSLSKKRNKNIVV